MAGLRELNALWRYGHVVLSPHLDDAVLSLGATIAKLASSGERVLIYTVCAGLPSPLEELNAIAEELTGGSANAWVRMRRGEDEEAANIVRADHLFGTALDAIFRLPERYCDREALFGAPDPKDSLLFHTFGMLAVISHLAPKAKLYAPLAIGGHVDHQLVRAAALRALPAERLLFYEDFPYVLHESDGTPYGELVSATRVSRRKEEAIAAYKSQIESLFGNETKMRRAVRSQKRERVWRAVSRRD